MRAGGINMKQSNSSTKPYSLPFEVGDKVWDDVAKKETTIIDIWRDVEGNYGILVDSPIFNGIRNPWEISSIYDIENTECN
jgi:hypothetical protein